jgi:hypothetical protein
MLKSLLVATAKLPFVSKVANRFHAHSLHRGTYPFYRKLFIQNGLSGWPDSSVRAEIVDRFEAIDDHVVSGTSPTDGLVLAEAVLNVKADGDIVECGCYAGASSAKLSIVAKIMGKRLIVCDSFEGLPTGGEAIVHTRRSTERAQKDWKGGDYSAGLERVRANIETFGEASVCSYVKGWYSETLNDQNLPPIISAAFTDVDLMSSAKECLLSLWPRLSHGGIFFSHDVPFIPVLQALYSKSVWNDELKSFPPIFFGAGYGINDLSPHMGYMVKGDDLDASYFKALTLEK